jgi:hypothetical protein
MCRSVAAINGNPNVWFWPMASVAFVFSSQTAVTFKSEGDDKHQEESMMSKDNSIDTGAILNAAIRYYWAMVGGDEKELRRLFDGRAPIVGYYQGEFQWLGLDAFIDEAKSLIGQHGEERCSVESIRVDGEIATVALRGRYAGLWFLDHLSFIQVSDRWIITNKSFHVVV